MFSQSTAVRILAGASLALCKWVTLIQWLCVPSVHCPQTEQTSNIVPKPDSGKASCSLLGVFYNHKSVCSEILHTAVGTGLRRERAKKSRGERSSDGFPLNSVTQATSEGRQRVADGTCLSRPLAAIQPRLHICGEHLTSSLSSRALICCDFSC